MLWCNHRHRNCKLNRNTLKEVRKKYSWNKFKNIIQLYRMFSIFHLHLLILKGIGKNAQFKYPQTKIDCN